MNLTGKHNLKCLGLAILCGLCFARPLFAQSTSFTYQGKLSDTGPLANGSYDFQFLLFDTPTVGTGIQQGGTVTVPAVQVTNGIFTVNLDFGAVVFPGADRFLEIGVRPAGGGAFTPLSPRQQVTSTPFAIRSLNATAADGLSLACLNCVTSSQIQTVQGSQITGTIPLAGIPAGSGNYIQNTTSQQATSNFNISGNGMAGGTLTGNIVSATTQFNIGASRMLSNAGTSNTFVGINAGQNNAGSSNTFVGTGAGVTNTTGGGNAFFGAFAGQLNTSGPSNAFFGVQAGRSNTTGSSNSFFGYQAGISNTTANNNSFFGTFAGVFNSTGINNTFVGMNAGNANTTSSNNAFFGSGAGQANTGAQNSFFGRSAGQANTGGASNSFFGFNAGLANTTGGNNSFFGQNAGAANNGIHNSFFGDSAGAANTASFNAFFGDSAGLSNTTGTANAFFGRGAGLSNTTGNDNSFFGFNAGLSNATATDNSFFGFNAGLSNATATDNSFFGSLAGSTNTAGANSFFGSHAGAANTTACCNAFFGEMAGFSNTTGDGNNAFFGSSAGDQNTSGCCNAFFGTIAGTTNTTGSFNTAIGQDADVGANNLINATAIGAKAQVTQSNSLVLGSIRFVNAANADTNVGIGTTAPQARLHVNGIIRVDVLGAAGGSSLCRNILNQISTCSSSLRYKKDISPFAGGLDVVARLRPIIFTWRDHPERDLGLAAEDVAKVEPLLVTHNANGEIEGVKYDHLNVVLINAIKEQQTQIKEREHQAALQQTQIELYRKQLAGQQERIVQREKQAALQQERLQEKVREIEALKRLVCSVHPNAKLCGQRRK